MLAGLTAAPAAAQNPRPANRGPVAEQPRASQAPRGALRADLAAPYDGNVEETRRRLHEVLQQYPPSFTFGKFIGPQHGQFRIARNLEPNAGLEAKTINRMGAQG